MREGDRKRAMDSKGRETRMKGSDEDGRQETGIDEGREGSQGMKSGAN